MFPKILELLDLALKETEKIARPLSKVSALAGLAEVFYNARQDERGRETLELAIQKADSIKRPEEKAAILARIGRVYAEARDISTAKELINRSVLLSRACETTRQKIDALLLAGAESAEAGLNAEANQIVSEVYEATSSGDKPDDVVRDLVDIADIYYVSEQKVKSAGVLAEAQVKASGIKDDWLKTERLLDVIEELAFIGFKEQSVQVLEENTLKSMIPRMIQPYFLLKIARFYLTTGYPVQAHNMLERTEEVVNRDELAYSRLHDLMELAGLFSQLGDTEKVAQLLDQAKNLITTIEDTKDRIEASIQIGSILSKKGETGQALDILNEGQELCLTLEDIRTRIYFLGEILLKYVQLKVPNKVEETISEIIRTVQARKTRTPGLRTLIEGLLVSGEVVLSLRLVSLIVESEERAPTLTAIAENLLETQSKPSVEYEQAIQYIISQSRTQGNNETQIL